ncbi:hypothetical protein OGAPHI_003997 [Ogataea philodendri]|uniref:Uncharacterized protein n=1 Tax=Ogataea philodendri TaxID=1378263 RepID=A0A9P8T509_9ASCO|nr:uncharacterized protein OGAPHI_003997 [Ogataea philodendri]KAH3665809.1 hypothetical protein OGAPHI_003997 [Ogataea philodendri]
MDVVTSNDRYALSSVHVIMPKSLLAVIKYGYDLTKLLLTVGGVEDNKGDDWGVFEGGASSSWPDRDEKLARRSSVSLTLSPPDALMGLSPVVGWASEMLELIDVGVKLGFNPEETSGLDDMLFRFVFAELQTVK